MHEGMLMWCMMQRRLANTRARNIVSSYLKHLRAELPPPHVCAVKKVTQIFQLLMTMDEINVHSDSMMQTRTHKNVIGVHTKHGNT